MNNKKIQKTFFIYIFFLSIVIRQLHAMDKSTLQLTVIPDITHPRGVVFCGKERVGIMEPDTFTLFNTQEQKNVLKVGKTQMFDLAASKDGKVALFSERCLTIYDADSGQQKWQKRIAAFCFFPIAFNLQDSSEVLLYNKDFDILHTYSRNVIKTKEMMGVRSLSANCLFTQHPQKRKFIHGLFNEGAYCYTDYTYDVPFVLTANGALRNIDCSIVGQEYSYDGACFAAVFRGSKDTRITFVPDEEERRGDAKSKTLKQLIVALAFHPNNKIIFLLNNNNSVGCWGFCALSLSLCRMFTINVHDMEPIPLQRTLEKRLSISPDGKKLCVALKNKCLIMRIPSDVL